MSLPFVRLAALGSWLPFGVVTVLAALPESGTHHWGGTLWPVYALAFGLAVAGALALGVLGTFRLGRAPLRRRSLLLLGALLLWLLAWNRSLITSPWPDRAWLESLVPLGATGIGVLATLALARARDRGRALLAAGWGLAAAGLLLGARALSLWVGAAVAPQIALQSHLNELAGPLAPDLGSPWRIANAFPFGHPNYLAAAALLLLPPSLALALAERSVRRLPGLIAAALLAIALATSGSRAGALGSAAVLAGAAALALDRLRLPRSGRLALLAVALVAAVGLAASSPRVRLMAGRLLESGWRVALDPGRAEMVARGLDMGAARPWSGWGAGSTPLVYPAFRAAGEHPGLPQAHQLHSTPVQLFADHGLPGPLSAGLLLLAATAAWWHGRRSLLPPGMLIVDGAALGLLGGGIVALTDYALDVPFLAALPALLLGLICAPDLISPPKPATPADPLKPVRLSLPSRNAAPTAPATASPTNASAGAPTGADPAPAARGLRAGLTFFGLITALWLGCFGVLFGLRQALVLVTRSAANAALDPSRELTDRLALWERAAAGAPTEIAHRHGRAWLLTEVSRLVPPEYAASARAEAAAAWDAAREVWSEDEWAHFTSGWLRLESDPAAAEAHFRAAARLVPEKTGVHHGLGLARRAQGDFEGMISALALEWFCNPRFALLPIWGKPEQARLRDAVQERWLALHAAAAAAEDPSTPEARDRRRGRALVRWWLTGETDAEDRAAIAAGPRAEFRWLAAALDPAAADPGPPPDPALLLAWRAWRGELPGFAAALGVYRLRRGEDAPPPIAGALGAWLSQPGLSFSELLRSPPDSHLVIPWSTSRPAQPLLDRLLASPIPRDLLDLQQEIPVLFWMHDLLPARNRPPPGLHTEWLGRIGTGVR